MQSQAVVIGSGMCGLATAEVLAGFFDHVVVIERDTPESLMTQSAVDAAVVGSKARPGVQQYHQLHGMFSKGLLMYDDIFDGKFTTTLAAAGATMIKHHENLIFHHPYTGMPPWLRNIPLQNEGGIPLALCTRHLFETSTRKLVMEKPRVEFKYGVMVAGLQFEEKEPEGGGLAKRVTGVCLSDGCVLSADLVVDCSGRGSSLPTWLAAAGCQRPHTTRATVDAGYAAWMCKLAPEVEQVLFDNKVHAVVTLGAPPASISGCVLFHLEDGMWMAMVSGNEGVYPGRSEEDVMRFARENVWHPSAGRLLSGSTFLAPVYLNENLTSTWRHYEDITLPDGLVVLGDGICSFNPTYGQGMTVAASEVVALKRLLSARAASVALRMRTATAASAVPDVGSLKQGVPGSKGGWGQALSVGAEVSGVGLEPSAVGGPGDDVTAQSDQIHMMLYDTRVSKHTASAAGSFTPSFATHCSSTNSAGSARWLFGLHTELQAAITPKIKAAWNLAVSTDLKYAGSTINEPLSTNIVDKAAMAYVFGLFGMGATDPVVNEAVMRVMSMLDPPGALMKPQVLARFAAFKAAQHIPTPLKRLAAALVPSAWVPSALKPLFGQPTFNGSQKAGTAVSTAVNDTAVNGTAAGSKAVGEDRQAALADLMGWPPGWREPQAVTSS